MSSDYRRNQNQAVVPLGISRFVNERDELFKQRMKRIKDRQGSFQNDSFGNYIRYVFKHSLITSFPEIAISKTWKKIILKLAVFLACLFGFLYQTWHFLQYYLAYPTIVNVEVSSPFEVVQPALTLCSNNLIRRNIYCERNTSKCNFYSDRKLFCDEFPRYCPKVEQYYMGIPSLDDGIKALISSSWKERDEEAPTEEMISRCVKVVHNDEYKCSIRRFPFVTEEIRPCFCYTIESQIEQPDSGNDIYSNKLAFDLHLQTFPEEYFSPLDPILIYAVFHDRKHIVNPYSEGLALKGGYRYTLYVSMNEEVRLPYPYSTNCTDYIKLWRENNGTGPLNQQTCVEYCKLKKLIANGLCVDPQTSYAPHLQEICEWGKESTTEQMVKDCETECQPACRENKYTVKYDEVAWLKRVCEHKDEFCQKNLIPVEVSFRKFWLNSRIHQPKYESIELFSYIGGFMGLWLGLNLISIFDFFESISRLLYYALKKWNL